MTEQFTAEAYTSKAESLADKMNALTKHLSLSDELECSGDELVSYVKDKTKEIQINEDTPMTDLISLGIMVEDFQYVRTTLRETTDNARRVLTSLSMDLLGEDDESKANLIASFALLNKSIGDNMKLYMLSYKDISQVLLNLEKIRDPKKGQIGDTTNNTIIMAEPISTAELIKQLVNAKKEKDL